MKGLINRLTEETEIQTVYFNEDGSEWLFDKDNKHTFARTRDEVFADYEQWKETNPEENDDDFDDYEDIKAENAELKSKIAELKAKIEELEG